MALQSHGLTFLKHLTAPHGRTSMFALALNPWRPGGKIAIGTLFFTTPISPTHRTRCSLQHGQRMDISSLIDRPSEAARDKEKDKKEQPASSSASSSPVATTSNPGSRRQTVHSLLNDDEDSSPVQSRRSSEVTSSGPPPPPYKKSSPKPEPEPKSPASRSSPSSPPVPSTTTDPEPSNEKPTDADVKQEKTKKRGKRKPKKYDTPPIWAQEWRGKKSLDEMKRPVEVGGGQKAAVEASVSGLPASLANYRPCEELTRKVTEWLFSNMHQLGQDRQYLEVEIKLGKVLARQNDRRIDLPVVTETIIQPDYARSNTSFQARMDDQMFNLAMTYMDKLCNESKEWKHPVTRQSTKTRDVMFASRQMPEKLRVTYNETDQPVEKIVKKRIADLMVFSPGDMLDLRISINLELPPNKVEGLLETTNSQPSMVRKKNRTSYFQTGMQIDATAVISNDQKTSKEVEIELDTKLLNEYVDGFNNKTDKRAMEKFEELVRMGLDNSRLLNRQVSR